MSDSPATWVPPGHFYSPLVDPADPCVERAMALEAAPQTPLAALGLDEPLFLEWFERMAAHYPSQPFPEQPAEGRRYHYANPNFPLADALALLAVMTHLRPARYIEVGSGYSSCAALDIDALHLGSTTRFTFIDPHPELAHELLGPAAAASILPAKLQDVPLELFQELGPGSILFIDSSHVAKTGSDVVDYLFRILPVLRPGVHVHIHDIFYPFEYPRDWIAGQNRSWNEAYLLRAWLHNNARARVLFLTDWFYKCRREQVAARMPLCIPHRGGSLWLEIR
jgi:hypothetical protein